MPTLFSEPEHSVSQRSLFAKDKETNHYKFFKEFRSANARQRCEKGVWPLEAPWTLVLQFDNIFCCYVWPCTAPSLKWSWKVQTFIVDTHQQDYHSEVKALKILMLCVPSRACVLIEFSLNNTKLATLAINPTKKVASNGDWTWNILRSILMPTWLS